MGSKNVSCCRLMLVVDCVEIVDGGREVKLKAAKQLNIIKVMKLQG